MTRSNQHFKIMFYLKKKDTRKDAIHFLKEFSPESITGPFIGFPALKGINEQIKIRCDTCESLLIPISPWKIGTTFLFIWLQVRLVQARSVVSLCHL